MLILVSISIAKEKASKKANDYCQCRLDKIIGEDNSEDSMNEDE